MKLSYIISNISKSENITEDTFKKYIKSFEKYIKSEIKNYDDISGLEDFKMNNNDYNILFVLYNNTSKCQYKLHILLLYMYSFYKLDGINFNKDYFPVKLFFNFLYKNNNIHKLVFELVTK